MKTTQNITVISFIHFNPNYIGQYYHPVSLDKKEYLYSHDTKQTFKGYDGKEHTVGVGLKLMEHSWIENPFVKKIEFLLTPKNRWYKSRIVWSGDYADDLHLLVGKKLARGQKDKRNIFSFCLNDLDDISEQNSLPEKFKEFVIRKIDVSEYSLPKKFKYILNHTKKEYVDKGKVINKAGWKVHPLPILTSQGNGLGGGDLTSFQGSESLIGSWAGDVISVEDKFPKDFEELIFDIYEL